MMISLLDIMLTVVILYFAITAAYNGFINEIFGKLAFFLGFVGAVFLCGMLSPYFDHIVRSRILSACLSFMIIFAVIFLFVKIIQMLVSGIFRGKIAHSLDQALGFVFGLMEGVGIVCLFLIIAVAQPWGNTAHFREICFYWELLGPSLAPSVDFVAAHLR